MNLEKNNSGFTLIELIVSITILGLITTISIANYKKGGNSTELIAVTQDIVSEIRKTQSFAMSSEKMNGVNPPGGWGIKLQDNSSEISIFADLVPDSKLVETDNELYSKSKFSLSGNVFVSDINVNGGNRPNFYITFIPPDPTIDIAWADSGNNLSSFQPTAEITFSNKSGDSKILKLNSFGLIDVE